MSAARSGVATMAWKDRFHFIAPSTGHVLSSVPMSMPSAASRPGARKAT